MDLPPLPFIIPLLVAAALVVTSSVIRRTVVDAVSTAAGVTVTVICVILLLRSIHAPIVYWFGGWRPHDGVALGISFVIDPLGAGMATLAAVLVTASFVFSWQYFEEVRTIFHVLMLVFLAAMAGFCLTGDLFDMFVFFELMGVAAFALTGYKVEEKGPIQGALSFAITNSVGAYLILWGIGLLYGRSGALNLAQIGHTLSGHPADGLVIAAFALITVGFFVKAAIAPFHFWLADAHAVAPTPVCVLFSGVMVELGVYAVARIYWTVFAGALGPHEHALRAILVVFGVVTALLGAVMSLLQHHLKRLLAFSTISHAGIFVIGMALLTPLGLAGSAVYMLGHAMVKGALFLCTGLLVHRFETFDENHLRGRGRDMPFTGVLFAAGGLGLAGLPPFGTFLGKGMIEDASATAGYSWLTAVLILASIGTGGAALRVVGSVFLGWGESAEDASSSSEGDQKEAETKTQGGKLPVVMIAPTATLMIAGLVLGAVPNLGHGVEIAAARFQDRPAYTSAALGIAVARAPRAALEPADPNASMVISGLGSTVGAVALALLALFRHRLPTRLRAAARRPIAPVVAWLQTIQSGHIGDYVAWLTLGVAIFGGALALALR